MKYTIGIDLGGTTMTAGLVDEAYNIVGKITRPTLLPRPAQDLEQALATDLRGIPMESRKKYRNAMREALKKPVFVPHVGTHRCSIANYGPSSSPMGYLASALNW